MIKQCSNCANCVGSYTSPKKLWCEEREDAPRVEANQTACELFKPDSHKFCTICNAPAVEGENSDMICTGNDSHGMSLWIGEWIDFQSHDITK